MGIWRRHIDLQRGFDGVQAFYLNALMRSMMFALIGIFTPIFVYRTMLPILGDSRYAIGAVAAYYLLMRAVTAIIVMPISKVIEKFGFRRSVIVSCGFLAIYLVALVMASNNWGWLVVAAIAIGINIPLYWVSRSSVLSQDSSRIKLGRQLGTLSVIEKLAAVMGPLAGGFIIEIWGFKALYIFALIVMGVSIWPLISMPHHTHKNGVSWRGYHDWLHNRRFSHQAIGTVGKCMNDYSASIIWPLVAMLIGLKMEILGGVFSLVAVVGVLIRWGSGVVFDFLHRKGGKEDETMFAIASIGQAVSWIARIFVQTLGGVLLVDLSAVLFGTTYENISDDYTVMGGKRMHEIAYYTYRELTYSLITILFMGIMIVGAILNIWRELLFLTASLWMVVGIVQARESNIR